MVAHASCLGQARGAGGVDEQSGIAEADRGSLVVELRGIEPGYGLIETRDVGVLSEPAPQAYAVAHDGGERRQAARSGNHLARRGRAKAVREAIARELRVDQRRDDPEARQSQPDPGVGRRVRHHEGDPVPGHEALRSGPPRDLADHASEIGVGEGGFEADQRRAVRRHRRPLFNGNGERSRRLGRDRRGAFERPQPIGRDGSQRKGAVLRQSRSSRRASASIDWKLAGVSFALRDGHVELGLDREHQVDHGHRAHAAIDEKIRRGERTGEAVLGGDGRGRYRRSCRSLAKWR